MVDVTVLAYQKFGIQLKQTGREWHGSCPFCRAGTDRFVVWAEGNYWCRHCDTKGFLQKSENWIPKDEYVKLIQEQKLAEKQARLKKLQDWQNLLDPKSVVTWHNALTREHRDDLHSAGIRDALIDTFCIGYDAGRMVSVSGGGLVNVPAYTIPIVSPFTHKIVNIQSRLISPPDGVGRYRQVSGIPASNFYVSNLNYDETVIIVEGFKKAAVLSDFLGARYQVVGIPGINPHYSLLEELAPFRHKVLIPDPTSDSELIKIIARFKQILGEMSLVSIFSKVDDIIVRGNVTLTQMNNLIAGAARV